MAKDKGEKFHQVLHRAIQILNEHRVPYTTRWLYSHLNLLEHFMLARGPKSQDWFWHPIEKLQEETGIGRRQVIAGIKTLKHLGLIQTWQTHWRNKETGKLSEKHVTAFRILNI